jgi:hypothetical protein
MGEFALKGDKVPIGLARSFNELLTRQEQESLRLGQETCKMMRLVLPKECFSVGNGLEA